MAETKLELTPFAKILFGGIVGIVVLVGAAVGGKAILGNNDSAKLVIIKAETEPFKKAPADKGGLKINSLDSPVLSLLDKAKEIEDGVEVLRPPVSEPEPPPIEVTEEAETPATESTDTSSDIAETSSKTPKAEITIIEPAEVVDVTPKEEDAPQGNTAEEASNTSSSNSSTNESGETVAPEDEINSAVNNLPQQRPATPKIVATTDVNSPSYVVQFAAFKNETRAKNTAAVLSTKHKSRLDGMAIGYMRWGEYWRVVAEPMPRADANSLCSMFRSVGQECIIKLMESPNG